MPLLRKKPFVQEQVPPNLKADDEVFYCHLTGEVFQDYEAFYQRMILCNSLVWSCELSLRPNLTYKEAQESEENIRKTLEVLPVPLKRSVLMLVHHTRRSKVQILCDDIFDFLKNRYQINEKLEGKINGKWEKGIVTEVPNISNVTFICKHAIPSTVVSLKSPNKNKIKQQSFMDHKDTWPEPNSLEYKFEILKGSLKGTFVPLKGNCVRREKGIFVKEKLKMFLKQCCLRTTTSSDDGYWIVKQSEVNRYSLGMTSIISPEVKSFSKKAKKKESSGALKGNLKNESSLESKPEDLAPKLSKKKEKDEEKARKKDEKEKEKEVLNDIKKLENDFVKEFQKPREDLQLEDSKPFPTLVPFKCKLEPELVGDAIMVVEFVNIFGALLNISKELDTKITFEWLEEALLEHDAEGKYFKLLKSLLHSYLCMEQEETKQVEVDEHSSNSGDETSALSSTGFQSNNVDLIEAKETSQSSRAAAAWPLLHQGMALHEIPIEPFSLTEILRLHILSSGIKTNSRINWVDWQRRGQQQLSDNPCVSFRHTEYDIMNNLVTKCIYDFPPKDKLKILVLICNQALMLSTVREYMEDAFDKLKELRKQLRDIQHEESKRKQLVQKEKWQKVLADRNKHREEMKKKKEQKKLDVKTKDDQKEEDLQLEKQKKEAKDKKMEESFVEKYQLKESEILKEIFNYNLVINEKPLGQDRAFRNYWNLVYTDGLLVENNDGGAFFLANTSDYESEESDLELSGNERKDVANKQSFLPNVTVKDIVEAKENNRSIEDLVFKRYKLPYSNKIHELCNKSTILKTHMDSIKNGEDLSIYSARCSTKWFSVTSKEQLESIIDSLNSRGIRERLLKINLSQKKEQILNYYDKKQELELKKGTRREKLSNKQDDKNDIDKSMFKTMDDFIEANLCDQLVELEEQLWVAGLGGCKENRLEWRLKMEEKMMKLVSNVPVLSNDTEKSKTNNEQFVNGHSESEIDHENKVTRTEHEGDSIPVVKLPLHLNKKDTSRCSTPVIIPDSEKQVAVAELSQELFKIMKSVEMKYLKPPLGETEETRRLRIKEMIEAAKAESEVNKVKKLEKIEEEEQKKSSTCLNRWQESLLKCMNFSQVFVHLYTLDRSIIWDKSVQHVKCRICRRKGDEDEMLLCDGCDRGFHMSCLNPPLKKVPVGNWYCSDCRPVEIRRGYQKHLSKYKGDTEEDEEVSEKEEEYEESESEDDFDAANDNYQVDDDNDDGDEDESDASEHNELCTVCNKDGTLILCEDCPRGFHVECVYPPIKKIPRGSWTCQICRGADQDLPLRKRALTIENQREKVSLGLMSKNGKKQSKKEHSKSKAQKRHASPSTDNTSKRARLEISGDTQELSNSLCRSTTALSRQQLKQCTGLINEIFKRTEAELFLFPVDLDEVPDYTDFIDTPMDFSTIKSKLKDGVYSDISSFISDIHLIFSNCDTYNPPCSHVVRNGRQLKTFINKKLKDLKLL